MIRAHSRSRLKNPQAFAPLSLFLAGERGTWLDPSDMSTMFQDDAGTVPVTAADQVVGRILDRSGNGNHAIQAAAASKPILRTGAGLWWLEFDGIDDSLTVATISLSVTDKVSAFAAARKSSDAAVGMLAEFGTTSSVDGSFYIAAPITVAANFGFASRGTVTGISQTRAGNAAPISAVLTLQGNNAGSGTGDSAQLRSRVNGAQVNTSGTTAGNYGNLPLYIGRRAGASLPFNGNLYGLIVRGAATSAQDVASTEKYLSDKVGVAL